MPRPISWLPRLPEIRRAVKNSVRSHYDRQDIQKLFKLQPRQANDLLQMLPTAPIGRQPMVERADLEKFLDRIHRSENATAACIAQRAEKEAATRRKPRALVRRDQDVVPAAVLGKWMTRGEMRVPFQTTQELFDVLWRVASALQGDLEEFIQLYEPPQPAREPSRDGAAVAAMFEDLEQMEKGKSDAEVDPHPAGVLA